MSTKTTNYELIKPALTDAADITATNVNWDKIDTKLKELEDKVPEIDITPESIGAIPAQAFIESGTDLDKVVTTGIYRIEGTVVNAPTGADWSQLLVMHGGGDTITQIIGSYSAGTLWHRSGNPTATGGVGQFKEWAQVYDTEHKPTAAEIGAAPAYTYGTEDLTAGTSTLETGKLYFVYE